MSDDLARAVQELATEARGVYRLPEVKCVVATRAASPPGFQGYYESWDDTVYILPEHCRQLDRGALRWLVFHEFGHAYDCRLAGKTNLYSHVWNEKCAELRRAEDRPLIQQAFNDLQDYVVEKRLKLLHIPWPDTVRAASFVHTLRRIQRGEFSDAAVKSCTVQQAVRTRAMLDFCCLRKRSRQALEELWRRTGLGDEARKAVSELLRSLNADDPRTWRTVFPAVFGLVGPCDLSLVRKTVEEVKEVDPKVDFWMVDDALTVECFQVFLRTS